MNVREHGSILLAEFAPAKVAHDPFPCKPQPKATVLDTDADTFKYVCRSCIGHDNYEILTIGTWGPRACAVCGDCVPRDHPNATDAVRHATYVAAFHRMNPTQ